MTEINGFVASGFEKVREAFEDNFRERNELGAACAVYYQGEKVVDLWGGYHDKAKSQPWRENSMVGVFSTTKGVAACCAALAHSCGWLDYDERVATYWPEFAQNGKENVTVRQLLAHQAGLCTLDDLTLDTLADFDTAKVADALARKMPAWEPGTAQGYHCWTIGWLISELLRHVDPKGRRLNQFFQEEIAEPLGIEFYIGLPDDVDRSRLATLYGVESPFQLVFSLNKMPWATVKGFFNPRSLTALSMIDPKGLLKHSNFNDPVLQGVEMGSGNGIGEARALAKLYSEFATGGHTLGLTPETLNKLAEPVQGMSDRVIGLEVAFSLGFMKSTPPAPIGETARSYGCPGAGGSVAFADPDLGLGFAYVLNRIDVYPFNDPREKALREAVYDSVAVRA